MRSFEQMTILMHTDFIVNYQDCIEMYKKKSLRRF